MLFQAFYMTYGESKFWRKEKHRLIKSFETANLLKYTINAIFLCIYMYVYIHTHMDGGGRVGERGESFLIIKI